MATGVKMENAGLQRLCCRESPAHLTTSHFNSFYLLGYQGSPFKYICIYSSYKPPTVGRPV